MTKKTLSTKASPASNPVRSKTKSLISASGGAKNSEAVKEKIMEELGKMFRMGKKSVKPITVARACGYASLESKGFRNPVKKLKAEGKIVSSKDSMSLSTEMMEEYKRAQPMLPEAKTNAEHHEQVKQLFENEEKHYKNIAKMIDFLANGQAMVPKELANAMGYANVDSRGYRDPKNILVEGDYAEMKDRKIQLTDHMFPKGRPGN